MQLSRLSRYFEDSLTLRRLQRCQRLYQRLLERARARSLSASVLSSSTSYCWWTNPFQSHVSSGRRQVRLSLPHHRTICSLTPRLSSTLISCRSLSPQANLSKWMAAFSATLAAVAEHPLASGCSSAGQLARCTTLSRSI